MLMFGMCPTWNLVRIPKILFSFSLSILPRRYFSCCSLPGRGSGVRSSLDSGTKALMLPEMRAEPWGWVAPFGYCLRISEVSILVYLLSPRFYFLASLFPHSELKNF